MLHQNSVDKKFMTKQMKILKPEMLTTTPATNLTILALFSSSPFTISALHKTL